VVVVVVAGVVSCGALGPCDGLVLLGPLSCSRAGSLAVRGQSNSARYLCSSSSWAPASGASVVVWQRTSCMVFVWVTVPTESSNNSQTVGDNSLEQRRINRPTMKGAPQSVLGDSWRLPLLSPRMVDSRPAALVTLAAGSLVGTVAPDGLADELSLADALGIGLAATCCELLSVPFGGSLMDIILSFKCGFRFSIRLRSHYH